MNNMANSNWTWMNLMLHTTTADKNSYLILKRNRISPTRCTCTLTMNNEDCNRVRYSNGILSHDLPFLIRCTCSQSARMYQHPTYMKINSSLRIRNTHTISLQQIRCLFSHLLEYTQEMQCSFGITSER